MARFLVVDDDRPTVKALTRLLQDDGHEVSAFTSGADALEALEHGSFDAVVADLEMPRPDGRAVIRAARERQPRACLVVASVRAEERKLELSQAGVCIAADKPIEYDDIIAAVAECRRLGGPGAHGRCRMRTRKPAPAVVKLRRK
jgi:CheY-like chemotaxis protein